MSGQPVMLRTSERTTLTTCRQRWDWAYNRRLRPRTPAPALRFGTLVHRSLAHYYRRGLKRGPHPAKTFEKLYHEELETQVRFGFRDEDGKWADALEVGVDILNGYIQRYGKDEEWEVLATEMPFQVPVTNRAGAVLFYYVGTVDGVWRHVVTKEVWIPDHKTTKNDPTNVGHLILDEQAGSYWTFGVDALRAKGFIKPNHDLRGMIFNFLKKAKDDPRPENELGQKLNQDGKVSKQQPTQRFHREPVYRGDVERQHTRERVYQQAHEMWLIRQGKLHVYIEPSFMHCGGCPFKDPCELKEAGANYEPLLEAAYEEWDPYSEHELYDRN